MTSIKSLSLILLSFSICFSQYNIKGIVTNTTGLNTIAGVKISLKSQPIGFTSYSGFDGSFSIIGDKVNIESRSERNVSLNTNTKSSVYNLQGRMYERHKNIQ
jgi:hypothetical protein